MRLLTLSALTLMLPACGEGGSIDDSLKATVRQQLVATCEATAESQVPEGLTVNLNQLCSCAADKVMAGKSAKDLIANPPTSAEDLNKVQECLTEIGPVKIDTTG